MHCHDCDDEVEVRRAEDPDVAEFRCTHCDALVLIGWEEEQLALMH